MRRKEHSRSPDREDAKRCRLQPDTSELGISSAVENRVLELKNRCLVDEQAPENYVPPLGKDTVDAPDSSAFPLLSNFMDFLEGKRQVMLLMGDPGSGKTFFLRQLERELWEKYHGLNDPIPIFVSLSDVDNVTSDLLGQALRSHLFDDDHIRHLKRSNRQIILICDGYDEIHVQRNIYNSNKFNTPEHGRVKLVIACRSCKIGRNSDGQFRPESTNRYDLTDRDLFQKVAMAPFTNRMVVEYVEKYVARQFRLVAPQSFGGPQSATHQSQPETPPSSSFESMRVWAVPQYLETLRDIPSLMELVVNPFILSIVLTMLSTMTNPEREVLRSPISFDALYKHIFGRWIKVAERRLYSRVMARDEDMEFRDLRCSGFEENCMAYMKRLVVKILGNQKKASPVRFIINHGAVWRARCLETVTGESLLQESVPLTRSGTSSRFIFPSHFDYMFSLLVFDPENLGMNDTDTEASSTDADDSASDNSIFSPELVLSKFGTVRAFDKGHPLGITNIAKRSMAVQFLADRVQNCQFFKKQLVEIVRESRNNKDTDQTLASNAVTILVRSGMRFNSADLRGIKIKGANLTGGEFDSADLRDADLTDVIFDKCWLRQAKLQGAKLKGAEFGEKSLDLQYVPNTTAYSVDGALYAVAFTNGSITIFDATNWNPVHTHQVSKKSVTALAFSPKGGLLAYGDRMGMLRRWNYNSGALMAFSDGHGDYINGLVYSPDGNQIATADDKKVAMWDADTGGCVNVMVPCTEGASSIAFSPDGKQLVSGGSDGIIRLWNLETDSLVCNLAGHGGAVSNVLFSPDGRHIASSSSDRTVRIWSATTGTWSLETTCIGHSERVISIAYSPDGQHLASCSEDGTIRTWDSRSGGSGPVFQGHTDHVIGVAYSQCGTQLTSCSRDKVFRLWDYRAAVKGAVLFGRTNNIPSGMYPYSTVKRQNSDSDKTIQPTRPRPLARTSESPSFGTTDTKLFAVSSNASLTASASANGNTHTINVSFVATSEDRYTLNGHEEISIISFSPNNQSIASGDFNGVLRVWNIESGEAIWTREEHDGKITGIAYSSNGEQIVSSGKDGTVRLWGTLSGDPGHVFETDDGEIECVAFSPCGSWVASGDENGVLMLWDPVNLIPGPVFANGHNGTVNCITFSPDGNHLVSAGSDNTVRIWDINRKTVVHVLEEHVDLVRCLAFSPTGERLVSGSDDCTMKIWNVATGVLESTLDHKEGLATVSFSSDGTQLWTGTKDRRIHEWTWASTGHDTAIIATSAFSKDGQHVASSLGGDAVQLWDTDSGKLRHILISHSATIESVSFSPVGDFVAIGSSDKMARIWDTTTGTCLFQLEGHSGIVTSVVFSPDGTQVATSSLDQTLRWWNLSVPGSESLSMHGIHWAAVGIYTHDDSGLFHAPVYSPDGSEISVISGQHGILRFDTRSKGPLPALVGHSDTATCIAYSPSGDRIATSSEDKTARIWDPQTGNELLKFVGHEDSVTSIAFSPFSYHIATSSADWSIRLWNVAGNTPYQGAVGKVLLRHTAPVLCIAYSPDGRFLASGSEDRTMRLWDPLTGDPLAVVGDFAVGVKTIQWRNSARGGLVLVTGCKENPLRVWEVVNVKRRQYEVRRYWGAGVESLAVSGTLISDRNMD